MQRSKHLIATLAIMVLLFVCSCDGGGNDSDENNPTYKVTGTMTLPASVSGKSWFVAIDTDHEASNGLVASVTGKVTGTTFEYTIKNIASGDYYLYAEVDLAGNPGPWDTGDYIYSSCGVNYDEVCEISVNADTTVDGTMWVNE